MVTSETVPYVKTGGLADVVSALSIALAAQGHEICIVLPRYYQINKTELELTPLKGPMGVPMNGQEEWCEVYTGLLPGCSKKNPVKVYFIDHEHFFGRDGVYGTPSEPDFLDNPRRFTFFAALCFSSAESLTGIRICSMPMTGPAPWCR